MNRAGSPVVIQYLHGYDILLGKGWRGFQSTGLPTDQIFFCLVQWIMSLLSKKWRPFSLSWSWHVWASRISTRLLTGRKKATEILTGLAWVILLGTDSNILESERDTWISSPASIQWDCTAMHHSKKNPTSLGVFQSPFPNLIKGKIPFTSLNVSGTDKSSALQAAS